jgi:hypothetical protein
MRQWTRRGVLVGVSSGVLQVPTAPGGGSRDPGGIDTSAHGHGEPRFTGRCSSKPLAAAPGAAPAAVVHASEASRTPRL